MSFGRLSIKARLAGLLVFVNALLFLSAGYAWYAISKLNTQLESSLALESRLAAASDLTRRAQVDFKKQVQEWKDLLIRGHDPALGEKYLKAFRERSAIVKDELTAFAAQAPGVGLSPALAQKALAEHDELDRKYEAALKAYKTGDPMTTFDVDLAVRGIDRAPTDHIDGIVAEVHTQAESLARETQRSAAAEKSSLVAGLTLLAIMAALVSAITGWLTIASITRRLKLATEVARTVASGDLTARIEPGRNDELGQLLRSLRDMNDSLASVVGRVRQSAESVSSAATQIAAGNNDLSSRTEEQASSLEETAASIEEMTATVNQNAQNAGQANQLAAGAAGVAQRGGDAVGQVVTTMEGDPGQLAQDRRHHRRHRRRSRSRPTSWRSTPRSRPRAPANRAAASRWSPARCAASRSARPTPRARSRRSITDSVERVNAGARIADDAGNTMQEIVSSVSRVSQLIGEIATATNEQSSGIAQANQAVGELDKATQQNAALVEESTAASESLKRLAIDMANAVAVFKLDDRASAPVALAGPSAHAPALAAAAHAQPRIAASRSKSLAPAGGRDEWKEF